MNIYRSPSHPTLKASTCVLIYNILLLYLVAPLYRDPAFPNVLVFWPHSVFGQNHLSVKML
jgi:hypothetical protein